MIIGKHRIFWMRLQLSEILIISKKLEHNHFGCYKKIPNFTLYFVESLIKI
jgi:hypothetical protein